MRCRIKRVNDKNEFRGYFARNLGVNQNHWVQSASEAKLYLDGRLARGAIRHYKLKHCVVEYEDRRLGNE